MTSSLSMDDVSKPAVKKLLNAGEILWKRSHVEIEAFLRMIIDERYHPKKAAAPKSAAAIAKKFA